VLKSQCEVSRSFCRRSCKCRPWLRPKSLHCPRRLLRRGLPSVRITSSGLQNSGRIYLLIRVHFPSGQLRWDQGEKAQQHLPVQAVVHHPHHEAQCQIWYGNVSAGKRGEAVFNPSKNCMMYGERYKTILRGHMLPFMKIHGAQFFLQDSAPCHISKLVTNRLKEIEDES
jgi:hypothetical protein